MKQSEKLSKWRIYRSAAACLLVTSQCLSPVFAQDLRVPADGRLSDLSYLYAEEGVGVVADVCKRRFSQTQTDWDQALQKWHGNNRDSIGELNRLQATIGSALKANRPSVASVDTWAAIVNARFEWIGTVYQMLAPMSDAQAKKYCDDARVGFAHDPIAPDALSHAKTAASAAVEDLARHD